MDHMKITNAQYTNNPLDNKKEGVKATIDGQTLYVPLDPDNRHYRAIQEWVAEGNTIEEAD